MLPPVPPGYRVWYEYGTTNEMPHGRRFKRPRRYVRAHIVDDDRVEVTTGMAVCNPIDQFVKKVGRDKALGRAVQSLRVK